MQAIVEAGDDAEIAAAALQAPEQVGVLAVARDDDPAIGGHHLAGDEVVAGEAVGPLEPAAAAAERQPGDAGRRHAAAGHGEPVLLGRGIELAPGDAGLGAHRALDRVDLDLLHRREVDGEAALAERRAGNAVAAALHRHLDPARPGEVDGRDDVGRVDAARDRHGMLVDEAVEELARLLVAGTAGAQHLAADRGGESVDGGAGSGLRGHGNSLPGGIGWKMRSRGVRLVRGGRPGASVTSVTPAAGAGRDPDVRRLHFPALRRPIRKQAEIRRSLSGG